jgi:ubiquinone/menaquinone biosynthesis C-methylase UbiE
MGKVSSSEIQKYFSNSPVLDHYQEATEQVGLWNSERIVFSKTFSDPDLKLLEIGCGAGRISFGLWKKGYSNLTATDFSKAMVKRSRILNQKFKTEISFQVEDATDLSFGDNSFDGAIFGFNGLMQIPGRENRLQAMREIQRVLNPGSYFVFTTHDQAMPKWKKFWANERKKWKKGQQNPELLEFGDRFEETPRGKLFIHVPDVGDVRSDLMAAGFSVERDIVKSKICEESKLVNQYSDDCRFWIARKK